MAVNTVSSRETTTQRCDLRLDEHGVLSVTVAGDWLSSEDVSLLRKTLHHARDAHGEFSLKMEQVGELSQEANQLLAAIADTLSPAQA